ncbi:hypothetical protein COP1_037020 [Malus domestica]
MTTAPPPLAPSHRTTITHSVLLRRHMRGLSLCTGSCHCSSTSPTRLTSPDLGILLKSNEEELNYSIAELKINYASLPEKFTK